MFDIICQYIQLLMWLFHDKLYGIMRRQWIDQHLSPGKSHMLTIFAEM
jgi:hypothetical protein